MNSKLKNRLIKSITNRKPLKDRFLLTFYLTLFRIELSHIGETFMQNLHLTTEKKKTLLPLGLALIQTFSTWLIPTVYSRLVNTTIQHTVSNQAILILFIFMFNFLVFDRFTNKFPMIFFLGMTGVAVLIAAFSFSSIAPTIGLLLFVCLSSLLPFFLSFKNNWAGWLLFTISSAFILPETLFYVQCGFLSTNFLKALIIPLLSTFLFYYPFFIKRINFSTIINLGIGALCACILLFTHVGIYSVFASLLILISWTFQRMVKQPKLILTINVILNLLFNILILMK